MNLKTEIKTEIECDFTIPQRHTITKLCTEDNDDDIDIIDLSDEDDDFTNTLPRNHVLEELNVSATHFLNNVIKSAAQDGATNNGHKVQVKEEPKSDIEDEDLDIDIDIVKEEPLDDLYNGSQFAFIQTAKQKTNQVAKKSTTPKKAAKIDARNVSVDLLKEPVIVIKDCLKPVHSLQSSPWKPKQPKPINSPSKTINNRSRTHHLKTKPLSFTQVTRIKPRKGQPKKKVATVVEEPELDVEAEDSDDVEIIDVKPSKRELDLAMQSDLEFEENLAILGTITQQTSFDADYGIEVGEEDDDFPTGNGESGDFGQKPLRGFSGKYLCSECDHSFSALSNLQRHVARFHSAGEMNLPKCHICDKVFIWKKYLDEHLESVHNHVPTCPECGTVLKNRKTLEAHIKFVHGKKEQYPCDQCDKVFHQKRSLQAHMTVHAPRRFRCEACPRQFRLATHLKYHVRQAHTRENLVHCQICGFGFTHGARLKVHMLTHFKIRPHKCHLCTSAFANKTQLRIHIMRHKGEKKHFCKTCGQGFVCGSALRIHARVHTGEKPYECEICHQKFATTGNRKIHMRLKHTRERPYSCSVCGKTFNLSNGLKAHMRIHTDEKPYSCDICGKAFRQSSHLHTHKRTHTGERPFPCTHCYKTFTQQSHLTTHMVTHTGEKTFSCQVCDKSFALAHSLKVHMRLHGTNAYKCTTCGEQFVTWNQYKAHQESECAVEESLCSVCNKAFREPGALVEHMKIHVKEATHMCNVCGKTFQHQCSLTSHMKIHTGERRFACDICNASFSQSSHLKSHVSQKHKYR